MTPHSILHLLNLDAVGGVEELFTHFLEASKAIRPCEHHILVTGKKPHRFFQKRLAEYKKFLTQEKYFYGFKIPSFLRQARRRRAINASNPEIIVCWNRLEPFGQLKALSPSSRIVYYEHGASWIVHQGIEQEENRFKGVDKIITCSHAAKRLLQIKWGITSPITVVENPLKPDLLPAEKPKQAPDLSQRALHLGYAGRLIPLKGVTLLLHAVKTLRDRSIPVILSIAGDGEDRERLQEEAKRLHIDAFIHFIGCIPNVSQFYNKIDLLLVPSIREPLGLVAQEAALCACPVIASLVDGLPEVVLDGKTGYCIPPTLPTEHYAQFGGRCKKLPDTVYDPISDTLAHPKIINPTAIADCIERLLQEPATYEMLSGQALAFAKSRPTTARYAKNLLDCLFSD